MLTLKQGLRISAIVDKLGLKITDPKAPVEQVGADLLTQILSKAHRAEKEIYALVADVKHISVKEAEDVDLVQFIKELAGDPDVTDFFKSAARSTARDK